jgi:Protein of unknown function (DUF3307)
MMEIEATTIIFLLVIHFLADFALQTHEQATNKSTSNKWLFYHVGTYSLIWLLAMYSYIDIFSEALIFACITFVFHFATDYVTSRLAKKFFDVKDYHNGFVVVGFDQLLHIIQLVYTYIILENAYWLDRLF